MKSVYKIVMIAVLTISGYSLHAKGNLPYLYGPKSGRVTYESKSDGTIMGGEIKSIGKERLIFDSHGKRVIMERVEVRRQRIMGQSNTSKSHHMTLMDGDTMYDADFNKKKILKLPNPAKSMTKLFEGKDPVKAGRQIMKQMGGKFMGEDTVLGYKCEVWSLMGTTQCIYKGVPLRVESNIMGIKSRKIAIDAKFDIKLTDKTFKLPDFPVSDMGSMIGSGAIEPDYQNMPTTDYYNQGKDHKVDMRKMTKEAMLPMMKRQFLEKTKTMRKMRGCLSDAENLAEAKSCARKYSDDHSDSDGPPKWDKSTKNKTLNEIDRYLNQVVPCVKNASTFQQLQMCGSK